jgi:hypothetical protein
MDQQREDINMQLMNQKMLSIELKYKFRKMMMEK